MYICDQPENIWQLTNFQKCVPKTNFIRIGKKSNKITKRAGKATNRLISPPTETILLKKNSRRAKKILANKNRTLNFPKTNTPPAYLVSTPGA